MRGVDLEQIAATVADGMKVVLMIGDIRLKEEQVGVAGDVYILDASVATPQNFANHFAKFTPSLIKKFLICVQVRYTLRTNTLCEKHGDITYTELSTFRSQKYVLASIRIGSTIFGFWFDCAPAVTCHQTCRQRSYIHTRNIQSVTFTIRVRHKISGVFFKLNPKHYNFFRVFETVPTVLTFEQTKCQSDSWLYFIISLET